MTFLNDLWASFQIFSGNFTDRYGLWVNGALLLLVLAAVGLFLWRSIRLGRRVRHTEAQLNLPEPSKKQNEEWCRKLSQAVSFPTVTGDKEAISQLRSWLKESFPLVFSQLRLLDCPGDGLLFQWRCPEKGKKGPVLLCAHMDVVPTEGQNWTHPPFEGEIKEETVYGRGALDCKGTLCGILQAAEELLQDGFAPGRDVYLAFGCDEETGGKEGAAQIAKQLKMRGLHFDLILDEGTPISTAHLGKENFPAALLGVAEKGQATFRLTARQKAGHAAMPPQHTAAGYLSEAICRIEAAPPPQAAAAGDAAMPAVLRPGHGEFAAGHGGQSPLYPSAAFPGHPAQSAAFGFVPFHLCRHLSGGRQRPQCAAGDGFRSAQCTHPPRGHWGKTAGIPAFFAG